MSTDILFIGREAERQAFKQKLANPYGQERIQYISGPGGIGKTWLLQAMLIDARQWSSSKFKVIDRLIDTHSTRNRHVEGIMTTIIEQLNLPDSVLPNYLQQKEQLETARKQEGYTQAGLDAQLNALAVAFRYDLQKIVSKQPIVVAFDTFEHVSQSPVGRWVLESDGLQMPGLLCIVAGRNLPDQPELDQISDGEAFALYKKYIPRFIGEWRGDDAVYAARLNNLAQGNPLLLGLALHWLDTSGLTDKDWDSLHFAEFQRRIASWLSPGDARSGLLFPGYVDEALNEPLRQTFVCMAYLNRRFNLPLLERVVQAGYVRGATAEQLWRILTSDKLPDFFYVKVRPGGSEEEIGEIQPHDKLAEMLRLTVLPYAFDDRTGQKARQFATDVVLWYSDLIETATDSQQKAILQAEKLAYAVRRDVFADIHQPEWQGTPEADLLARLLPPDFETAKALLLDCQQQHSDILNRLIVNELQPEIITQFPLDDRYDIYSMLGEMAREGYLLEESATYWHHAFETAEEISDINRQIIALRWVSISTWQLNTQKALELLNQAEELCSHAPELESQILYSIGFVYRQMQDLETAVKWYERALESARLYDSERLITPTILNDMGYALLLIGQYEKAEARIRMAAVLRERNRDAALAKWTKIKDQLANGLDTSQFHVLRQQEAQAKETWRDATLKLGMTYNTRGQLARQNPSDVTDATGHYTEALTIFEKLGNFYWQAQALQARGDALRRLALARFFTEQHESSQEYDQQAFEDIDKSLTYCRRYGYVDLLPMAYRRMGRLMHDRALRAPHNPGEQIRCLREALTYFETGIKLAEQSRNMLEQLENSTEIAFLADDFIRAYRRQSIDHMLTEQEVHEVQGYIKQFREMVERHRDAEARIYQFLVFNDLYEIEQGAFYYALGDYGKAFNYYLTGYTGLASDPGYGSARCQAHFEHLLSNIRNLPDPQMKQDWYQRFINAWEKEPMQRNGGKRIAEAHPKLIEQLRLHQMFE